MSTGNDVTRLVRSWLQDGPTALPGRVLDDVMDELASTPQRPSWWRAWRSTDRLGAARLAIAAVAVVVVTVVGLDSLTAGGGVGGPATSASPASSLSSSPSPGRSGGRGFVGLPPEGTTPSDPAPGALVVRWDGSLTVSGTMWVYADGRLLTWRLRHNPGGLGDAYTGITEQRLTPGGVEFLKSAILATDLFDTDLVLAREGNAPFLRIEVLNGDRLVDVTWAWRGISGDAPVATPEQEAALRTLDALLTSPASWPSTAWEDQAAGAYVPSEYGICFRSLFLPEWSGPTEPIEAARIWSLLPERAEDLLRAGELTDAEGSPYPNCSRASTDDARAVARILEDAGIERGRPAGGEHWLRFLLRNQGDLGDEVWISFAPVLPHGESTWLGPG